MHYSQREKYEIIRLVEQSDLGVIRTLKELKVNKTTSVNQMWQTDFTYFKIYGWGWYYLSTILDDYSRFIVSWELCSSMKAMDVKNTIDKALFTVDLPENRPPKLQSDNGSCYISNELAEYLQEKNDVL